MINTMKIKAETSETKALATNAGTEIYKAEPGSGLPIASDNSVEDARDWVNDGSKL